MRSDSHGSERVGKPQCVASLPDDRCRDRRKGAQCHAARGTPRILEPRSTPNYPGSHRLQRAVHADRRPGDVRLGQQVGAADVLEAVADSLFAGLARVTHRASNSSSAPTGSITCVAAALDELGVWELAPGRWNPQRAIAMKLGAVDHPKEVYVARDSSLSAEVAYTAPAQRVTEPRGPAAPTASRVRRPGRSRNHVRTASSSSRSVICGCSRRMRWRCIRTPRS